MKEVQPLNPNVLLEFDPVPNSIIDIMNRLIKKNWNGTCSIIRVNEILGMIQLISNFKPEEVINNRWLDSIRDVYENRGFIVQEFGLDEDKSMEFTVQK